MEDDYDEIVYTSDMARDLHELFCTAMGRMVLEAEPVRRTLLVQLATAAQDLCAEVQAVDALTRFAPQLHIDPELRAIADELRALAKLAPLEEPQMKRRVPIPERACAVCGADDTRYSHDLRRWLCARCAPQEVLWNEPPEQRCSRAGCTRPVDQVPCRDDAGRLLCRRCRARDDGGRCAWCGTRFTGDFGCIFPSKAGRAYCLDCWRDEGYEGTPRAPKIADGGEP